MSAVSWRWASVTLGLWFLTGGRLQTRPPCPDPGALLSAPSPDTSVHKMQSLRFLTCDPTRAGPGSQGPAVKVSQIRGLLEPGPSLWYQAFLVATSEGLELESRRYIRSEYTSAVLSFPFLKGMLIPCLNILTQSVTCGFSEQGVGLF